MQALNKPELSYFLGMCIARGYFVDSSIIVRFKYKNKRFKLPPGCDISELSQKGREYTIDGTSVTELLKEYLQTDIKVQRDDLMYSVIVPVSKNTVVWDILYDILGPLETFSYKTALVPESVRNASLDIKKHFIRGVADSCSIPTFGDRDWNKYTRICLDIPFENWKLPVQICRILQESLNIPVDNIIWGHPNLRTPTRPRSHSWTKEHRIRFYSKHFIRIGFGLEFKQKILEMFVQRDNQINKTTPSFCWPDKKPRIKSKPLHPDEHSDKLPSQVRKHICNFREICIAMGCTQKEKK